MKLSVLLLFFLWLPHPADLFLPGPPGELNCPGYMFKCGDNKKCIVAPKRCDGIFDCDDKSDEHTVSCVCTTDQWQCTNNPCISKGQRCDGSHNCKDGSDEDNCGHLYDGHLSISPLNFTSNGSQAFTLTCNTSSAYHRPESYAWSIKACQNWSSKNTCTFTPDPAAEEFKTVRCTVIRSVQGTDVAGGSVRVRLNFSNPPPGKPVITSHNSGREYLQPGDVVTCTVTGGSPPVESVHLSCLDPSLPDQDDERDATAVASSFTITSAVHDKANVNIACFCNATWSIKPQYYPLTSTAKYNVGRSPRKLFNETLTMTGDGIVFALQAYPAPGLFAFTHLGDSRSGPGNAVNSTLFTSECTQNTIAGYTVSCAIVPSSISDKRLGIYVTTVSNAVGSVVVTFQTRQEDRAIVESLTINDVEKIATLNRDDQVMLKCQASGRPAPNVTITHGYTVFGAPSVHHQKIGTSSQAVLTLSAAHCDDMGTYTCTATNGIAGSDTKTIRLNVNCPPKISFHDTKNMTDGRLSFHLEAFPVPDRFIVLQIVNQTASLKKNVSQHFSAVCGQVPMEPYLVNCEVMLLDSGRDLTGLFRADVHNTMGKADFYFNVHGEQGQSPRGVWLIVLGAILSVIIILATCIAVFFWVRRYKVRGTAESMESSASIGTRGSVGDYSSSEYEEVPERGAIQTSEGALERIVQQGVVDQEPLPSLSEPLQDRPLPELPETAVVVISVVEQSLPTQEKPLPALHDAGRQPCLPMEPVEDTSLPTVLSDAGVPISTDRQPDPDQAEEMDLSDLVYTCPSHYDHTQEITDDELYSYTQLDTPPVDAGVMFQNVAFGHLDDSASIDDFSLCPVSGNSSRSQKDLYLHPVFEGAD